MSRFATGVTVVTSRYDGQLHGMTANAVTSVSLNPLLVLVSIDHSADSHAIIAKGRAFTINILSSEQEAISRVFARKREPHEEYMRGVPYRFGRNSCPIIEGCIAYIECQVVAEYDGGDHTLFIGQVENMEILNNADPLIFYMGGYTRFQPPRAQ